MDQLPASAYAKRTSDHTPIHFPRELHGEIHNQVQTVTLIRRVRLKLHRSDQSQVVLAVLRAGRAVEVDEDGEGELLGPGDGAGQVGLLR